MPPFPFGGAEGETESGANNWDGGGTQDFPHEFILLHCEKGTIGIGERERGGYDIGGTTTRPRGGMGTYRTLGGARLPDTNLSLTPFARSLFSVLY